MPFNYNIYNQMLNSYFKRCMSTSIQKRYLPTQNEAKQIFNQSRPILPLNCVFRKFKSDSKSSELTDGDDPIKFSESNAASWKSEHSFFGSSGGFRPYKSKYEFPVVLTCLTSFLIYFLVLREENDLDLKITKAIAYQDGESEEELLSTLVALKKAGKGTSEIEQKLVNLRILKEMVK